MEMPISNRKNLIVAADDFGLSKRANRNILYLISLGKIDRVAVLADGIITTNETLELIRSGVKLDIHLDLTSTINDDAATTGTFSRIGKFLASYLAGNYRKAIVEKQWTAQIDKFHELFGKYPDGINSHEHIHFFPPFFQIVIKLQEKYPIPYLRFAIEGITTNSNRIGRILTILRKIDRRRFKNSAYTSSDRLVSLDWISDLDKFRSNLPAGTTEIVCHPHRAEEFVLLKNNF